MECIFFKKNYIRKTEREGGGREGEGEGEGEGGGERRG